MTPMNSGMTDFQRAQAKLHRLTSQRRRARVEGRSVAEYDREINALLQKWWACDFPDCSERVTLGMIAAHQAETIR